MPPTSVSSRCFGALVAVVVTAVCGGCTRDRVAALFRLESYRNVSTSMEPTIRAGTSIAAIRFADLASVLRDVHRGDVVVHQMPTDTAKRMVKRVIGMPGDTIGMRGGVVFVNAVALAEPYTQHTPEWVDQVLPDFTWQLPYLLHDIDRAHRPTQNAWGPLVMPMGAYLLLGDNRDNSMDSRYFGLVDARLINARIPPELLDAARHATP